MKSTKNPKTKVDGMLIGAADYRDLLKVELKSRQQHNVAYSQRAFARDLGIAPHRLSEVFRGKQGLSATSGESIAVRLGLSADEKGYFLDLIRVRHSRSPREREDAKARLSTNQAGHDYFAITLSVFQCLSDWLAFAILELTKTEGFKADVREIARRFGVTEVRVKAAAQQLENVGLLKREAKNWTALVSNTLTARGVPSRAIKNFHRQTMQRALHALYQDPMDRREFSSLLVACDKRRLPELKERMRKFLKDTDAEFRGGSAKTDVACLSLQLFLLTDD